MICGQCAADNPDDNKFCGTCGKVLKPPPAAVAVPGDDGAFYCARHPKSITRLRCGRCDTAICPKCMVQGVAGARCRKCANRRVAVRPAGVLHAAGRAIETGASGLGRPIWYMAIWYFIRSLFFWWH